MDSQQAFLLQHSAHNYERLISRWRAVADEAGLSIEKLVEHCGQDVYALRSETPPDETTGIYLCAGVHGDEPGGSEGLIAWAESHLQLLKDTPCMIFPCFNPSGILANTRMDGEGVDLNREFQNADHPLIAAWRGFVGDSKFRIALCLHEDYDAHGLYIYELSQPGVRLGEQCLQSCEVIIPREPDLKIEGRAADNGVIHAEESIEELAAEMADGLPEALYLRLHHAPISLTFETPSEYSLYDRVRAHIRFIETALSATVG